MNDKTDEELLKEFTDKTWGEDFKFRKFQKEVIIDILKYQDLNPNGSYILDAPTGSGKSIFGMCVAGVLLKKGLNGYILTSDLGLQRQYENDFDACNVRWKTVRGKSNYPCHINGQTADVGDCIITKQKPKSLKCYSDCEYFNARAQASMSRLTLLNYSYWLMQMNHVYPNVPINPPFAYRDFIIADEAHKVTEIVQSHFSPVISSYSVKKLYKLNKFLTENELDNINGMPSSFEAIYKKLVNVKDNTKKILDLLADVAEILIQILDVGDGVSKELKGKYGGTKDIPEFMSRGVSGFDYTNELHNKILDFIEIANKTSHEGIVIIYNDVKQSVTLKNVYETYLMESYFHDVSNFQLYMSATITGSKAFMEDVGISNAKYVHVPSTWEFDKSEIYVYAGTKMSYNLMQQNLPWLVNKIESILERHSNERGIIHTGSYHLTESIHKQLKRKYKDRILLYKGSAEKNEMLDKMKRNPDGVIIGPSIIEGIDLYDDLSRFQIVAKVPYPSMGDKFVVRKMNIKKNWYKWKTINSIIQGVGRSIRNEDDHATTYILDGNFLGLYSKNLDMFPPEFKKRVRIIK